MDKTNIDIFESLQLNDRSLFNPTFRNCMMHYAFKGKNGKSNIKDEEYNMNKPFLD